MADHELIRETMVSLGEGMEDCGYDAVLETVEGSGIVGRAVQTRQGTMVRDVRDDADFGAGVDAKTGKTTEPAREVFCRYVIHNSGEVEREVKILPKKGYEIYLPKCSGWSPPPQVDYEKISTWPSEDRMSLMKDLSIFSVLTGKRFR